MLCIAVFGGALVTVLLSYGLPRVGASYYAIVGSLEIVSVLVFSYILLGERLTELQWVGAAFVIGGVVLRTRN
jgi:drug/metabolite transporter (DMT)-like permease